MSVYSPPPSQSIVHVPFGTIKTVVWEQCWHHRHGSCLNEIIGTFCCSLLQIVVRHRDGREIATFSDSIVLEFLQEMPVLVRSFAENAVKIGVSGDVVCLSGYVVVCGGNTWSVNFRNVFFLKKKKNSFFQNLRGDGHFSLRIF